MSRDDSGLYTGASSASLGTTHEQPIRAEKREEKLEKRLSLTPAGDVVKAEIEKEMYLLMHAPYANEDAMSDEQFRAERRARRLAVDSLVKLNNKFANLLRKNTRDTEPTDE